MSLRERLAKRARPSTTFHLRVEDDTAARMELDAARASGDDDRVAAAQAAVDACYEALAITALTPADWEALVDAHPATPEQRKAKPEAWCNQTTFLPALLAACVEGDETEDDWADFTSKGALSLGETNALFDAAMAVNQRWPDPHLGKGSTTTIS